MQETINSVQAVLDTVRQGGQWSAAQVSKQVGLGVTRAYQTLAGLADDGALTAHHRFSDTKKMPTLYSYNRLRNVVNTRPWTAQGLAELQGGAQL